MAKAKVKHSADACTIIFKGDPKSPEPSTGVIKFPGGHVEVSRTSDGKYWAHVHVDESANIDNSRIDYGFEGYEKAVKNNDPHIPQIPYKEYIQHMAILVDGPYKGTDAL